MLFRSRPVLAILYGAPGAPNNSPNSPKPPKNPANPPNLKFYLHPKNKQDFQTFQKLQTFILFLNFDSLGMFLAVFPVVSKLLQNCSVNCSCGGFLDIFRLVENCFKSASKLLNNCSGGVFGDIFWLVKNWTNKI